MDKKPGGLQLVLVDFRCSEEVHLRYQLSWQSVSHFQQGFRCATLSPEVDLHRLQLEHPLQSRGRRDSLAWKHSERMEEEEEAERKEELWGVRGAWRWCCRPLCPPAGHRCRRRRMSTDEPQRSTPTRSWEDSGTRQPPTPMYAIWNGRRAARCGTKVWQRHRRPPTRPAVIQRRTRCQATYRRPTSSRTNSPCRSPPALSNCDRASCSSTSPAGLRQMPELQADDLIRNFLPFQS